MAWTYDATQFNSTTAGTYTGSTVGIRYQIRFVVQDVNTNRQLMQDAELDWLQTQEDNIYMAAAAACDILVAKAGSVKMKKVGPLELDYDVEFYRGLGARLRARGLTYQAAYAGGISISDKQTQEDNADAAVPFFFRGFVDNPQADNPSPGTSNVDIGYPHV